MATVTRGGTAIGRPRTAARSPAFYVVDSIAARKGLNVKGLAVTAGIDKDTLYRMRDPRLSTLRKIAEALGMPVSKLAAQVSEAEASLPRPKPRCR